VGFLEEFSFFPNFRHLETLLIIFPGSHSLEPLGPLDEGDEDFDFDNYDPSDNNLVTPERKLRSAIFKKLSQSISSAALRATNLPSGTWFQLHTLVCVRMGYQASSSPLKV